MPDSDPIQEHLPMKPIDYLVLLTLLREDRHGYGIVQDVEAQSGGRIQLEPGNLYRTIRRLSRLGLLEEVERRGLPGSQDERRRYYCLTCLGRAATAGETARLREVLSWAEQLHLGAEEGA